MASGQENTKVDASTLVLKVAKGSDLDDRVEYVKGELDISGSELVRRAVEAYLTANGQPAKIETKAA
jgi:hypothetical protein